MTDVFTLGEALIDFVSTEAGVRLEEAPGFHRRYGGSMANVAMGLARLGVDVGFSGMVGDDPFGNFLRLTMEEEGIETTGLHHHPRLRTTLAFVSLTEDATPDFVFFRHPGADTALTTEKVPRSMVEEAEILHTGSLALSASDVRQSAYNSMDWARERDRFVSIDPNLRLDLWDDDGQARADVMRAVEKANMVKCSEEEATFLSGQDDLASAARELRSEGPDLVIITRGSEGSYLQSHEYEASYPSYTVDAVDTTGAGDAFSAGFISKLLDGGLNIFPPGEEFLDEAVSYASSTAAMTSTDVGTTTAFPYRSDVQSFLESRGTL